MLVDKLKWCCHGNIIFSLHVQQNGNRFATGGNDASVKIWSLAAALDVNKENDESTPQLLATLTDHTATVNVVRFSPKSSVLATGSDDCTVFIYELHRGPGGGVLGGESNIENWRIKYVLKGHTSNICDLGWSPDGELIATASLDNKVIVWDANTGKVVKSISEHASFVKGVAWDPVGTYLATQSDDKSVLVWRRDDWSIAGRIATPFEKSSPNTFATRMSWSPDGQYLMFGNSFQDTTHAAVAVRRERWEETEHYLLICGHKGPVTTACFAPHLYYTPPLGEETPRGESLSPVFALGAKDGKVSVWAASAERPYFVGKKFFQNEILDMAWTPDGRALLACSSDQTVGCFQFEVDELGPAASKEEMNELRQKIYGSTSGRERKRTLVESIEQIELQKTTQPSSSAGLNSTIQALDARIGGDAGTTQTGFGPSTSAQPSPRVAMPPPPKKIVPEPVIKVSKVAQTQRTENNDGNELLAASPPSADESVPIPVCLPPLKVKPKITTSWDKVISVFSENEVFSSDFAAGVASMTNLNRVNMTVTNGSSEAGGISFAMVKVESNEDSWTDMVSGKVVDAVGTSDFSAIGTSDGHVIIYTPKGRRKVPPISVGCGISYLACSPNRRGIFMVVDTRGKLRVFDGLKMQQIIESDLSMLAGGRKIVNISLSASGDPMVTLSDSSAYAWHIGMKSWMRVIDDSVSISNFCPIPGMQSKGELTTLQNRARQDKNFRSGALLGQSPAADLARFHTSRNFLEESLAAAAALGSMQEFKSILTSYVSLLAENGEKGRLLELANEILRGQLLEDSDTGRKIMMDSLLVNLAQYHEYGSVVERCRAIQRDMGQM